jgi:TRAP-type C4-dicarboxylate transport system permease small subunit
MFGRLRGFIDRVNRVLAEACGWLLCMMVLFLCFDIVSRSLKEPVQGVTQMAVFVMIIVIYLGLGQCEKFERHIKVTAVCDRLPEKARAWVGVFNYVLQIVVIGIITISAGENVLYSIRKHEAVMGYFHLPLWPTKAVLFIGLVFYWLQTAVNLTDKYKHLKSIVKK